jgi:hypothetical protein
MKKRHDMICSVISVDMKILFSTMMLGLSGGIFFRNFFGTNFNLKHLAWGNSF